MRNRTTTVGTGYSRSFAVIILASCVALSVRAQTTPGPGATAQPSELGEIVVTAQKREQRAMDVGESLTVASGDQLVAAGVTDLTELPKLVPSLSYARTQFGYPILSLRGVGFAGLGIATLPTVSTYVDEALLAYPAMTQGAFLDVERLEVLKGPQGTLFGENVTGGLINIIAAKPTDHFSVGVRSEINNFGGLNLESFVSGPLSDSVRARFAASTEQWGAWQQCYHDCDLTTGAAHRAAARLLIDWTPISILKVSANLNGNYDDSKPQEPALKQLNIQVPPGYPGFATYPPAPNDDRAADFSGNFTPNNHDHSYQFVLREDLQLDPVTLTSITNYANTHTYTSYDGDSSALPIAYSQAFGSIESFNQELRLSGRMEDPNLHYVAGVTYQRNKDIDGNAGQYLGYSGFTPGVALNINNPVGYTSKGIFTSADWEFVKDLTLTAGARYAWLDESASGCIADAGNGLAAAQFNYISDLERAGEGLPPTTGLFVPGGCFALDDRPAVLNTPGAFLPYDANLSKTEQNLSWKGALNYKPTPDTLVYGSASRGFKAGGYQTGYAVAATQFAPYKQEELTAYEIGAKSSLLDRTLDISSAIFYYDYINKQFLTDEPGVIGIQSIIQNIPSSDDKSAHASAVGLL
jgi:iron complex outermembrane receptor protein